jgi:hypothetical protein
MKSPLLKGFLVVVVAVVSIGICIIGYQRTRQQIDKPQESETEVSIPSPDSDTQADLDVFKQQLDELYIDDDEQFIAEGTSSEEVAQLTEELNNSAISPENTELSEERAQLLTALEIVSAKISIQEATNQLFVVARNDWQDMEERQPIDRDVQEADITAIENQVANLPDGAWKESVLGFVGHGREQIQLIESLRETLEQYANGSPEVTYEQYLIAVNDIQFVRNDDARAELNGLANQ